MNTRNLRSHYKIHYKNINTEILKSQSRMSLTWRHPFTSLVTGPTGCGKTQFTIKLVKFAKTIIEPPPEKILWCYEFHQKAFDTISGVEFHEGIPETSTFDEKQRTLLILDDLMHETDNHITKIFTKISHRTDVSVLYLSQNLFYGGKTKPNDRTERALFSYISKRCLTWLIKRQVTFLLI